MSTSTRVHIMLPNDTLQHIDEIRGLIPRSAFIRDLIEASTQILSKSPVQQLGEEMIEAGVEEISKKVKPKQMVIPNEHRHRYDQKSEQPVTRGTKGRMSVPFFEYKCSCGKTQVGP